MKTLVIGLGNPILTDDGVGIYTARAVQCTLPPDSAVDVIELSVGGLALMEAMVGYERVILIDAFWQPMCRAGEVVEFDVTSLPGTLNTASAHDVNLPTALDVGRHLGAPLPRSEDIHIIAVGVSDVLTFGQAPTPDVADAIPLAAKRVLTRLGYESLSVPASYYSITMGGYDDFA